MSAQAALEDMAEGKTNAQITPFWRVISSLDKISKKLDIDPAWIDQQRSLEGEQ
jgi:alkylated DNA nucleotide flippase Atl1